MSFGEGEFTMDYAMPPRDREPVTTIAWRLAHLIVVFASTTASHFGAPPARHATFGYSGTAGGGAAPARHLSSKTLSREGSVAGSGSLPT